MNESVKSWSLCGHSWYQERFSLLLLLYYYFFSFLLLFRKGRQLKRELDRFSFLFFLFFLKKKTNVPAGTVSVFKIITAFLGKKKKKKKEEEEEEEEVQK